MADGGLWSPGGSSGTPVRGLEQWWGLGALGHCEEGQRAAPGHWLGEHWFHASKHCKAGNHATQQRLSLSVML